MKNKLFVILFISMIAASLILAGCTKQTVPPPSTANQTTPSAPTPKYGGVLKVAWDSPPMGASLGWPADYSSGLGNFGQLCLESLLRSDEKGSVYPWLAESYKVADDLKSITFILRKGVKFHDGTDFNAQAAKWNLENQISAKKAPYWASVEATDEYSVRVNLKEWRNNITNSFSDTDAALGWIVSPTAFQKNGIDWMKKNPVGTGAFKFVSYSGDVGMKTVKNPDYWQKGKPFLDAVECVIIVDPMTMKAILQNKEADMTYTYAGKQAADCEALGLKFVSSINGFWGLIPDSANADSPWANQKVREAVEYAMDRKSIAQGLGYGFWEACYQIPARSSAVYNANFTLGRQYNIEKARQLLSEAGYPNGFQTTIICFAGGLNRDAIIAAQSNLKETGIQADLDFPEIPKYTSLSANGWRNGVLHGPILTYGSFITGLGNLDPASTLFKSWLRTPEFMKAYNTSLIAPASNNDLLREITDTITKQASIIPVRETGGGYAFRPYVMDGGWGKRGYISYMNYENLWLNK
jgi:peptide/nickel transport system substrate-binding protein